MIDPVPVEPSARAGDEAGDEQRRAVTTGGAREDAVGTAEAASPGREADARAEGATPVPGEGKADEPRAGSQMEPKPAERGAGQAVSGSGDEAALGAGEADGPDHPLVRQAIEIFGARVVNVQPRGR